MRLNFELPVSSTHLLLTLLTVLAMSAGQILFKMAAQDMAQPASWVQQLLLNPKLWLALLVYGGATLAWVMLLRQVPLNVAYPFVALAFLVVPLLSHWLLGEPLRWQSLVGAAVIVVGVWISVSAA